MRIQSINNNYNQNCVAHKAYFKPNEYFSEICKHATKTPSLCSAMEIFKNKLPKHEIEVLALNGLDYGTVKVINNMTSKMKKFYWKCRETALCEILRELSLPTARDFYENKVTEDTNCYKYLIGKDVYKSEEDMEVDLEEEESELDLRIQKRSSVQNLPTQVHLNLI